MLHDEYKNYIQTLSKENPPASPEQLAMHPDVKLRKGFYQSELIYKIIYAKFFVSGELSDAAQFPEFFTPAKGVPLGLIAFVATMVCPTSYAHSIRHHSYIPQIEFVLKIYESGTKPTPVPDLKSDWVLTKWRKHMGALASMNKGSGEQVTSFLSRVLLKRARYVSVEIQLLLRAHSYP